MRIYLLFISYLSFGYKTNKNNYMKSKNILVTGGTGFIGTHLLHQLSKDKEINLYSLSTGQTKSEVKGVKYIKGHTKDIDTLLQIIPQIIYHLGQYSRTTASFSDPSYVWEQNCLGTFKIVQYCRKNKVKLVYAASSLIIAGGGGGKDQSPYAWTKATNVDLINRYGQWFGLDFAIVYISNVYGDRTFMTKEPITLLDIWKERVKNKQKLTIVAPGTQLRNFTFVGDIVKGLIAAGEKGKGDGYPLGVEQAYTLYEVAEMLGKNKPEDFVVLPAREGDRQVSQIDITKTKKELGWQPKVKLRDYLTEFVNQLKKVEVEQNKEKEG